MELKAKPKAPKGRPKKFLNPEKAFVWFDELAYVEAKKKQQEWAEVFEDCTAIKIQTDVFAELIQQRKQDNTLDEYYVPRLASYEFTMNDVFYETNSGVDYYLIENDTIINKASNDDN